MLRVFKFRLTNSLCCMLKYIFVSPAKQKRDICIAFPAAALSAAAAAA